ncbi:MAG TPA: hypothetical protein GXX30_01220 [Firmicutes bacterium]|uniref:Uncharacterized protein n=1 Tax=Candidatus Fermentithermobacillus carboniphilus TaxID=3085328 RepID=A0AAT9LDF0_9FIRM|nr:MAG: hypothetical protein IMF26_01450 [Candidatus Fermentithermobacillus carboniphilus]HHW17508.1 hypothetical protein [Candidatus Fermentithermobacillaceae bacterium]
MSHISSYRANIKLENAIERGRPVEEDPGWEILDQAIWTTAEELNLDVSHSIRDYYGRSIYCDWSLSGPNVPRGIGVNVDRNTGEVVFVCDSYGGYERVVGEIKDRIVQNYLAICVTRALSALNYEVEVEEVPHPIEGKKVLVKGVL